MTTAAENSTHKAPKNKTWRTNHIQSPLAIVAKRGDVSKAVAGFIECGQYTVSGGLLTSGCGLSWDSHCVFRTSSTHLVAIVNRAQCKWCKCDSSVQESDFDGFTNRMYLQGIFGMNATDTVVLAELIAELTRTQTTGESHRVPFTATPPCCAVENVTHISGLVLQKLIEFDNEFVWGDNLIFNACSLESQLPTAATMTLHSVSPLVSCSSRVGPVFCTNDQCAFVKVSKADTKRAVVNMTSMTLVDYADRSNYPGGPLRSDQSLFVPTFCPECYGTRDDDYAEALANIVACGSTTFLVGLCCVYGLAQDEVYPESRKGFILSNDMSFSGACHPQPGKAVFLHNDKRNIGRVKCYWHVHSRSAEKTFLYCCVACDDSEYTKSVMESELNMGFSLGTVGDNASGPVTQECSLVTVPMRPGCFCTMGTGKDIAQLMTRMGFSALKDSVLAAGLDVNESDTGVVNSPLTKAHSDDVSKESAEALTETVKSLATAVLDQAAVVQALKDVIEAMKVQTSVLTQRVNFPDDPDTLFTVQGAKDFTRRTGVKTKLCAGVTTTDKDTNTGMTNPSGDPLAPVWKDTP